MFGPTIAAIAMTIVWVLVGLLALSLPFVVIGQIASWRSERLRRRQGDRE